MLLVEKLAKEASALFPARVCASFLSVYNPHSHHILEILGQKMDTLRWLIHYEAPKQEQEAFAKAHRHVMFNIHEACFAGFRRSNTEQQARLGTIGYEESLRVLKTLGVKVNTKSVVFKEMCSVQQPEYMVFFQANQWAGFSQGWREENGTVNLDKVELGYADFNELDEAYSHLCKLPWMADSLVGKGHSLRKHLNDGAILKTKNLTIQQSFVKAITLRYPMEHHAIYTPVYVQLKKMGFRPSVAAVLALTLSEVMDNKIGKPRPGLGHDWCNAIYISEASWKAMMEGKFTPVWTQPKGTPWKNTLFNGMKAVHGGNENGPISKKFTTKRGEGWNGTTLINLQALKDHYDEFNS